MFRKSLSLIAGLGLVFVNSPRSNADICFQYGTGGAPLVARGLKSSRKKLLCATSAFRG